MRKIVMIGMAVAVVGVIALGLLAGASGRVKANPLARHETANEPNSESEVARLQSSVETLSQAIAALAQRMDGLERSKRGRQSDSPQSANPGSNDSVQTPETRRQRAVNAKEEAMDRLEVIENSFRAENRDPAWAKTMVSKLETAFRDGGYAGTTVRSTDCRTTFCRMEVSHENAESSSNFELIRRQVPGSYYMQHLDADENGHTRTVAFFIREGRENENSIRSVMTASR